MAEIHAFRGIRYDLGHVGALSNVVAPPYDVIDPVQQDSLYEKHPANVIRLILNREEPGDDEQTNRYARAARFLKNWQQEGVLALEADPAIYVYHQLFEAGGRKFTRCGFMCRTRLEPFGEGNIYPHEETHASAKADRLKLTRACRTNMSQIFALYPDPDNSAQDILDAAIENEVPCEATDHLGVRHRLWPVSDVRTLSAVSSFMAPKPLFIADGHHRYETACNYRDELRENGTLGATDGANFVLMMCVGMSDPGMIVLPTHRLFRGIPPMTSEEIFSKLRECFDIRVAAEGADAANVLWPQIDNEDNQGTIGLYAAADSRWLLVRINENGQSRMDAVAAEHSSDWRGLGVSILQRLILEELLIANNLPEPKYVHTVEEVVSSLERDENRQEFSLAALVMPATLDHIRAISEHGERMPAKSTYFYPKLLSGLVFNPLY